MKNLTCIAFCTSIAFLALLACSSSKKSGLEPQQVFVQETVVPDTFVLPQLPETLVDPEERRAFLITHYWDRFDFSDSTLTRKPAITEQAFVDYIHILGLMPEGDPVGSLINTLHRAQANSTMYGYFVSLMEKYFYDPNSPFHNEELYIPVLKEISRSVLLGEVDRSRYLLQLEMTQLNKVGDKANNFTFILPTGETRKLWDINSQYLLLLFSNPGCHTCETTIQFLDDSPVIKRAISMNSPTRNMLTILTIYPDSELEEWVAHLPLLPQQWLHGYDPGMAITRNRLYDIKAIPTIYLLDSDKKVILKDSSLDAVETYFSVMER